jgi:methanogenic corrinoid protein MtbC1
MDGDRKISRDDFGELPREGLLARGTGSVRALPGVRHRTMPLSLIEQTIEREVLPRLVLAHRTVAGVAPSGRAAPQCDLPEDVGELVRLVLARDVDAPASFVAERHRTGTPVDALYLDLMAPAARHLGWLWEEDLCDFTQVTIALGRLHHLVRAFSVAFHGEAPVLDLGHHALLVPGPGEQHTFGLAMVTEFFRRGGWTVWSGAPDTIDELLAIVRREWFAVVGFSLACSTRIDSLGATIHRVRRASRNRAVGVMVGGPMFTAHPELAAMVGADATATDGLHAVKQAQALLTLLADRG